jgi:hypothetical protein
MLGLVAKIEGWMNGAYLLLLLFLPFKSLKVT